MTVGDVRLDDPAVSKQITGPPTFHFRVKFYTSEPINLGEELTRYQFFLQLKQDILQGKMPCPGEKAIKVRFSTTFITSSKITVSAGCSCVAV